MPDNRLGTVLNPRTLQDAIDQAKLADVLGYDSIWSTDGMSRDAFVLLGACAPATTRVGLGTAIVTILPRHPSVMARSALSLNEVSGGRFRLGIGTGHRAGVENALGIEWTEPKETMREYIDLLRGLFDGPVKHHGKRWDVEWGYPQPIPPAPSIHLAALNPPLMELAGEIADGVVLWMATPEYIRDVVVPKCLAGRQKAGKTLDGFDIIAPVPAAVTDDVPAARKVMKAELARYATIPFYRREFMNAGYRAELDSFDAVRANGGDIGEALPDRLADSLGVAGSAAEVRAFIKRFRDAGASLPLVRPIYGPDVARTLREAIV